jgi:aromatic ring-opening dioxygenase LigB subunit
VLHTIVSIGGCHLCLAPLPPNGGLAIAEACLPDERDLAVATRSGLEELARTFSAAKPEAAIVATPHNVHIPDALGVIVASRLAGGLPGSPKSITLDVPCETELAWGVLESLAEAGLPATGVSFGSNNPSVAVAPMDWGVLIPLWYMGGRQDPPVPVVVVTPARDLSGPAHVDAGRAIAEAAERSGRRVAFIASADHGHAHRADGPYGYDPAAAEYDALVAELVRNDELDRLVEIPRAMVEKAKADSWWQMLMLHGATESAARLQASRWKGRLISYEAPTYFGMLTAAYKPIS